jgi:hypothetical protein
MGDFNHINRSGGFLSSLAEIGRLLSCGDFIGQKQPFGPTKGCKKKTNPDED